MQKNKSRREALKKLCFFTGFGIAATTEWAKPIVNSIVVPAHAQTTSASNTCTVYLNNRTSSIYAGSGWNPYNWSVADTNSNGNIYVIEADIPIPSGSSVGDTHQVSIEIAGSSTISGYLLHMPSNYTSSGNEEVHLLADDDSNLSGNNIRVYSSAIGSVCIGA
jgi:hypothetical protein